MIYILARILHRKVQIELYPPADWLVLGYVEHDMQKFLVVQPSIHEEIWNILVHEALHGMLRR